MSAVAAVSSATAAQFPMFPIPANVNGVVQDQSGAVIPKAEIKFSAEGSEKLLTVHSNEAGAFQAQLPAGAYTIRISSPGFATLMERRSIGIAEQFRLRATLTGAVMGQVVEVRTLGKRKTNSKH